MTTTEILESVSQWAIPALILIIILSAARKRVPMYESFVTGAKEGFNVAVMIIPYLVAILFAIKIFIASGIFDDIKYGLTAAMTFVGLGAYTESLDLLPLAMTKPLTGGGAAARAGIRPGDVIVSVDNRPVTGVAQFESLVPQLVKGKPVPVLVRRGESPLFLALTPPE